MKKYTATLVMALFIASLSVCSAQEQVERRQLKESELPNYDQLRDPFWPIGYTRKMPEKIDPNAPKEPEEPVTIEPKWPKLRLKAVTSSPKGYIAIIEGIGLVEEGQIVKKTVDGVVYRWKIGEISKKGFAHKKLDAKAVK
jgi:hypothetical protein